MSNAMRQKLRSMLAVMLLILTGVTATTVGIPTPAQAATTDCQNGGYYIVYARGATAPLGSADAKSLKGHLQYLLRGAAWVELGNLDNTQGDGENPDDSAEYPASAMGPNYGSSVSKGTRELIDHLNYRYSSSGMNCYGESAIIAGYSEGADAVGWAMEWEGYGGLSPEAKQHLGYVALYGDPKFDRRCSSARWWVKGDVKQCGGNGILGPREPYARDYLKYRLGSWCDFNDGFCNGSSAQGSHGYAYREYWYQQSAADAAGWAILKRNSLLPAGSGIMPDPLPESWTPEASSGETAPPPPTIRHLKRTKDVDGTNQVYAATNSAVTEGWWKYNGDGVHTKEIIHISQDNITGFDKTNLPEGKQALFTAVPDGIWETHWDATHDPSSAKIISGLTGVRQVIVDNRWEGANKDQYTHRLYVLASDGPYEFWWRDGGDGIHKKRLDAIEGAVSMTASTGPSGEYQLYVATPTWAYELWWHPGNQVNHGPVINITQGDINSLSKITFAAGQQRLYTGTSTSVWQSVWHNSTPAHNAEVNGKNGIIDSEAMKPGSAFQIYICTPTGVQEYWWTTTNAGNSTITSRAAGDITAFTKSNDSTGSQVYTGTVYGEVWESYWGGGASPTTKKLMNVAR